MKKDSNAFIKILIILVIASLALLAIVYFMMTANGDLDKNPIIGNPPVRPRHPIAKWFDPYGHLVIGKDINMNDPNFSELCEGSEWKATEEQDIWYTNEKYGYKIQVPYFEYYNDDLIAFPFDNESEKKHFIYYGKVDNSDYSFLCRLPGQYPTLFLEANEAKNLVETKDHIMVSSVPGFDPEIKELTIGDWDAVAYKSAGYGSYYNIIILNDNYNYHFRTDMSYGEEKLLNMIKNNFVITE